MHLQPLFRRISLILATVTIFILLLAITISGIMEYKASKEQYTKIMQARLHVKSSLINTTIMQYDEIIRTTITSLEPQSPEQLYELYAALRTFYHLLYPESTFYILDKDNIITHIAAPFQEYRNLDVSAIVPSGSNQHGQLCCPYQSPLTGQSVFALQYPLDNGYRLVVEIPLNIFPPIMAIFAKRKIDADDIVFILTDAGAVIYHSDHTLIHTRYNFGLDIKRQSPAKENELFTFYLKGDEFIAKSKQLTGLPGWSIYYARPIAVITGVIIEKIIDQSVFLLLLSISLFIVWLITFNIYFTRPTTRLIQALSRPKPGKILSLPAKASAGIREFHTIITAIKSRDIEIINSFERLKAILNGMDAVIYVADMTTHEIIFINNAFKAIYGDCISKPCFQSLGNMSNEPCEFCQKHLLLSGDGTATGVHISEIKDKLTDQWFECREQAILWPDGRMVHLQISTNINERKETEDALSMEKERLAVTLRSIGDAVISTDIDGKVTMINRVAEELTGWTNGEAAGKPSTKIFNIINERTGQKSVSPVQRVMELGRIVGLANHTALISRSGTVIPIADSGAPIRDRESKIIGVVIVFRNVVHERKMEEELLKIKKLESLGVLAGGIAHDFNNILAAILGNIDLLKYHIDQDDKKTATLLTNADKATRRAMKLTGQLLTFAKGGNPIREATTLPELIRDSTDFVLRGSRVTCRYEFPDNLWLVDADSGQLSQVIQNIVINSRHAMPEGGVITISCANVEHAVNEALLSMDNEKYIRIRVKDTGVGIPKEIKDKIFDPYFTTKQEGSGLGLAICHSIINKHEGYLLVDSSPGKGTIFTIYLPAISATKIPAPKQPARKKAVKAARIMVMDDDQMVLDVISAQLHTLGHEPVLTRDGQETINKYQALQDEKKPVDIIIMDLTIPGGMGGIETVKKLLAVDPQAKVIVISGYSNDPVMSDCKRYGFSAALGKPFSLDELAKIIESILD